MFQNQYHFNNGFANRPTWTNALLYYFFTDPHKYYCGCWLKRNSLTVNEYVNVLVFPVSSVCKMTSICHFLLIILILLVLNVPNMSSCDSLGEDWGSLGEIWHILKQFFPAVGVWEWYFIDTIVSLSEMQYQSPQCNIPWFILHLGISHANKT